MTVMDERLRKAMELGREARILVEQDGRDSEEMQRKIAESLDTEQRNLLARCWSGRAVYAYLVQAPGEALVLRSLIELGLVACPVDERGPTTTSRGRAVIGKMPPRTGAEEGS